MVAVPNYIALLVALFEMREQFENGKSTCAKRIVARHFANVATITTL
jgi:hypothetical protein